MVVLHVNVHVSDIPLDPFPDGVSEDLVVGSLDVPVGREEGSKGLAHDLKALDQIFTCFDDGVSVCGCPVLGIGYFLNRFQ
jgi:hypothetical protein